MAASEWAEDVLLQTNQLMVADELLVCHDLLALAHY